MVAYGIATDNWLITALGTTFGPWAGYYYADPERDHLPILKGIVLMGITTIVFLPHTMGGGLGTVDESRQRKAETVLTWSGYFMAASCLYDLAHVAWQAPRRKENWKRLRIRVGVAVDAVSLHLDF